MLPRVVRTIAERARYRYRLTVDTARFGARPRDRARIVLIMALMPLLRRLRRNWPTNVQLRLSGRVVGWPAENDADLGIIEEVFGRNIYELPEIPPPDVVIDLGAHVGASVLYFALRFPRARIVAVEPDPVNFDKLRRNVGHLPQVRLFHAAANDHAGTITLYSSGRVDSWSSSTRQAKRWQQPITVRALKLDDILVEAGVDSADVLKIDIEGAEYEVLDSFAGLDRVGAIVGEVHPELMEHSVREFKELLADFHSDLPDAVTQKTAFRARRIHG